MLTQQEVKDILDYNPETGDFLWIESGKVAGTLARSSCKEYRSITYEGKVYRSHRLAYLYQTGGWPMEDMDHINGNGLDNRWCNLRAVSRVENHHNRRKPVTNKSGVVGVCWDKGCNKWMSHIKVHSKSMTLGRYTTKEEAIVVRKRAEIKYGFHENHGEDRPL